MTDPEKKLYLTRIEAAAFLAELGFPATRSGLAKVACLGTGPAFRKFGARTLYDPSDLISWAESRLSPPVTSTSQLDQQDVQMSDRRNRP